MVIRMDPVHEPATVSTRRPVLILGSSLDDESKACGKKALARMIGPPGCHRSRDNLRARCESVRDGGRYRSGDCASGGLIVMEGNHDKVHGRKAG